MQYLSFNTKINRVNLITDAICSRKIWDYWLKNK